MSLFGKKGWGETSIKLNQGKGPRVIVLAREKRAMGLKEGWKDYSLGKDSRKKRKGGVCLSHLKGPVDTQALGKNETFLMVWVGVG